MTGQNQRSYIWQTDPLSVRVRGSMHASDTELTANWLPQWRIFPVVTLFHMCLLWGFLGPFQRLLELVISIRDSLLHSGTSPLSIVTSVSQIKNWNVFPFFYPLSSCLWETERGTNKREEKITIFHVFTYRNRTITSKTSEMGILTVAEIKNNLPAVEFMVPVLVSVDSKFVPAS